MISAGVCGLCSALSVEACAACFASGLDSGLALGADTTCASAEASWMVAPTGFERGVGTGSADFAAATLAGAGFSFLTGALPASSSSSVDLLHP